MAIRYTYRCGIHGDFDVHTDMAVTRAQEPCPECEFYCPKVFGTQPHQFQFTFGRDTFHSGADGTGETIRETARRWHDEAVAKGLDPEPIGYKHF